MRIPLRAGRVFTARDTKDTPRVAIVSQSTARRLWPGQDPLGKRISMSSFTPGGPRTMWRIIVGVVSDVRYRSIEEVQFDVYDAALQTGRPADNVVIRTAGSSLPLAAGVRAIARELDTSSIVDNVTTLDDVVARAEAPWRLTMWMFVLFAALAFGLAALGLFSLVAIDIGHRAREFAIRMALGASRPDILQSVLGRAGRRAALGVGLGLAAASAASRAMRGLLFAIGPDDALTTRGFLRWSCSWSHWRRIFPGDTPAVSIPRSCSVVPEPRRSGSGGDYSALRTSPSKVLVLRPRPRRPHEFLARRTD
jgi:hypothetical protein